MNKTVQALAALLLLALPTLAHADFNGAINNPPNPFAYEINFKTYGAVGDDVTDDTAAINNALNAARTALAAGPAIGGIHIVCPQGTYKTTASLNFTGLAAYPATRPVVIDAQGCKIDARFTGTTVASFMGDTAVEVNDLQIYGDHATGPTTGIQWGRIAAPTAPADRMVFNNVVVTGNFTNAACYNMASETNHASHLMCYNSSSSATSYGAIFDGINHFGLTDSFAPITQAADTAMPFDDNVCDACEFKSNAGGPTIWMANIYRYFFNGGYVLNQHSQPAFALYTGVGAIYYLHAKIHMEAGTMPENS